MTVAEIVLAIVLGLVVNEMSDASPWAARRLVRWSARLSYGDTARGEKRVEELAAVIDERPGKLFKLGTAARFVSSALVVRLRRLISGEAGETDPADVIRWEDASGLVSRYLFPTEKYRGEWRRHWIHPVRSLATGFLVSGLAIWATVLRIKPRYAGWIVAGIVVYTVGWIAFLYARWYLARFVITDKRLMSMEGVFTQRVRMMPLIRVTDMQYVQSPIGRMLNYGTFKLEGASRRNGMRRIKDLPNPNELYLRIVEEMYEPEAVEVRLAEALGTEPEAVGHEPEAPVFPDLRLAIVDHLATLSAQLTALATAVERLDRPAVLPPQPDSPVTEPVTPDRSRQGSAQ
jgi:membrane protein YdbS with pleckstrin-like domain